MGWKNWSGSFKGGFIGVLFFLLTFIPYLMDYFFVKDYTIILIIQIILYPILIPMALISMTAGSIYLRRTVLSG